MKLSVPNVLALMRVIAVPIVMVLIFQERWTAAAVVFTIAAVTDFFDGFIARRMNDTTTFGAFLDLVADKLLTIGTLMSLLAQGRVSLIIAFAIIGREMVITSLRSVTAGRGVSIKASDFGKAKAWIQFVAVGMVLIRGTAKWGPLFPDEWAMAIAAVWTVASGVEYLWRFRKVLASDEPTAAAR
ncbi:MAG: CDP-diacylglycerol--glycerol-3-phosphate 3-phosphatidyltransferase [Acidimicrobiia bacterium]|nr:CDP-diacylglycerol--glycerol-3-phosphate 3-phosphatidyltransferase [Acidimicrobiia bacterium]MBT8250335.1 CDP-diacylglycerol--glycerol-3-phosphate 3-phosphatidyltransferase [Acidimicrobiia bacterium]NND14267.1 CDP-diacylglycerol--glycerol-3-phosphate 3-phosphatidyltransferase [Acidimicrobiia bacterium]NNL28498.1 CDP-diacylglycerol--glycerol-3-phosphate 3-phosphatidyltransferase [Acidimicrobiia bacterium]NNL47511.1 CDP-diacylglycerol--glycerol-3-phosphate 3-phosphatidyltransferase [Acidimicro